MHVAPGAHVPPPVVGSMSGLVTDPLEDPETAPDEEPDLFELPPEDVPGVLFSTVQAAKADVRTKIETSARIMRGGRAADVPRVFSRKMRPSSVARDAIDRPRLAGPRHPRRYRRRRQTSPPLVAQ